MIYESELNHHGILGQKWGVRRYQNSDGSLTSSGKRRYSSTSLKSAVARRQNAKVDASFKKWDENSQKKSNAIELGKASNAARMKYESDRSKDSKKAYKESNREYKKALRGNTAYRKGQIRQEVGSDLSRKYLSEAKKVGKQLNANPNDRELQKKYDSLMSKHDVERASARRAVEVGAKRSRKIASVKRTMTMTTKVACTTAAVAGGLCAANKYLANNVSVNGKTVQFNAQNVKAMGDAYKIIKELKSFIY